ncbi:9810_t:CDS:2 [Entrophospora sp. SA101]|nr:12517_t:CDS:2 [Entrophospora sp. SA101]CAJ0637066.1 6844_t:CDS:2 [Entrophospora sp. SA101]CAJ0745986.1 2787_t:CDS:2 [Entrophospora sp. SA101]CAJ0757377.1 9810_t:CDS:2 [Entrophospora sp. SA101]CAJ0833289.1 6538_t:CDS:2 [Entrophospora sp. SA101]
MKLMLWSLHLRDIKEIGSDIFIGTSERLHDLIVDRNTSSSNNNINIKEFEALGFHKILI